MKKILFIGGDKRSIVALNDLKSNGFFVSSYGLFDDADENIGDYDVLVLPVPTTKDKKTVYCPLSKREIPLSEIEKNASGKLVITCGYSFSNADNIDILSLDSYAYLNAVPTAEGAISFAIENTDFTLWGSKILIIGYGRVARVLADRLSGFGCDLTVSARNIKDFAVLDTKSIKHIETAEIPKYSGKYDIIFNTVDVTVFGNAEQLKHTLLIDLSSKGCIDFEMAKENNLRAFKLPGIPGKIAPVTAGKILASTVIQQIRP